LTKKNQCNEKEIHSSLSTPSIVQPTYTVVLISSIMVLLLFNFVSFNFDFLNIKEIDASTSDTTVSSLGYYGDKSDVWRDQVNQDPYDNCVSGGSVNC
jgi:hypothetical protein